MIGITISALWQTWSNRLWKLFLFLTLFYCLWLFTQAIDAGTRSWTVYLNSLGI